MNKDLIYNYCIYNINKFLYAFVHLILFYKLILRDISFTMNQYAIYQICRSNMQNVNLSRRTKNQ